MRKAKTSAGRHAAGAPLRETGNGQADSDLSDAGLVTALARGRRDALAVAYSRHGASVYALAARLCGPRRAEEMTQAVFLSLRHSPGNFHPGTGSLRSLLVAEAHRRAVGHLRADAARQAPEATMPADALEQRVLDKVPGANEAIGNLLSGLSKAERQAITLAYFGGYSRRQVAAALELPAETVNAHIRAGMGRLRAHVTGEGRRLSAGDTPPSTDEAPNPPVTAD